MDETITGQVSKSAAEVYDEFFVPALFLPWAAEVADAAELAPGRKVLDVACGTGVLTREAAGTGYRLAAGARRSAALAR
jgi:ubiquinone/menaquinone biosynthesis C-methylase UbiE